MPSSPARIRLLGPVAITGDADPVRIAAPKLACVLAILAVRPGTPVARTDLIDRVWDGDPPDAVLSVLYSYVARLRTALKPVPGAAIRRAGSHGYVLDVEPEIVDLHAIRALRGEAETLNTSGRTHEALEVWRRACELAGGEALAGIGGRWADETRAALAAERVELLTGRYTAELDAGNHAAVLGDLAALNDAEPLAEPVAELLMLAYYRCGRPADALARFETIRVRLRDELGADPSKRLRDLHLQILDQDPALEPSNASTAAPIQLPSDTSGFTGRAAELKALDQLADPVSAVPLAVVVGPGGAGKTALAVHWGHTSAERFPGGVLYVNLRGYDKDDMVAPREALGRLLLALGRSGKSVPEDVEAAAELFRTATADRGVLVILDNARNAEQVRPLLPGPGCFTIVTSRDRLTGLVALNDARPVQIGMLEPEDAVELLGRILGAERVAAEAAAAERLADLCGHLPLALRIAAAHAAGDPNGRVADHVEELERRDRLEVLAVDGDSAAAVTSNLEFSYRVLDEDARRLFCQLGTLPGEDFAEDMLAAVSGLSESEAIRAVRRLVAAHLVEQYRSRRYRMHDLVRLYAARQAKSALSDTERAEIIDKFISWHYEQHPADSTPEETNLFIACETLRSHPAMWQLVRRLMTAINGGRFLARVADAIEAGRRVAEEHEDARGVFHMVNMQGAWLRARGDIAEGIEVGRHSLELAADLGDFEMLLAKGNQGLRFMEATDYAAAAEMLTDAVELAARAGKSFNQANFASSLAMMLIRLGRAAEAAAHLDAAEAAAAESPIYRFQLKIRRADMLTALGRIPAASAILTEVFAHAAAEDPPFRSTWCLSLGVALIDAGRPDQACEALRGLIDAVRAQPDTVHGSPPLCYYAEALNLLGDHRGAIEHIAEADRRWHPRPPYATPMMDLVLAQAHNGLGEYEIAARRALDAANAYAAMPWPARHELALLTLADAHAGLGDTEAARARQAEADQIAAPINRLHRGRD
ncbi:AfsR/SARP family transcriptional regulator [Kribbella deserti]|uniref:BTAD domain-containing putative transcriptional regulator n=1 Tax=Kribbella deserti TaxID=1926257 RepID=A0ABV6QQ64_9ACTN